MWIQTVVERHAAPFQAGSWVFQAPIETNTNIVAAKMSIVIGLLRVGVLSGCSHHNEMKLKLKHISTRR